MRRKFKDEMQQKIYDLCMESRPTVVATGIGQAFFFGYENPDMKATGPRVGRAGSQARAAWAAGVDCRRADDKAAASKKIDKKS